jgi:hypothetical protein
MWRRAAASRAGEGFPALVLRPRAAYAAPNQVVAARPAKRDRRGPSINTVLLSAGAACVIIAVVGGGASAFGVQIPLIESRPRQVLLFVLGVAFLAAAVIFDNGDSKSSGDSEDVKAYRQQARATCAVISRQQQPPQNPDFSFDRDVVLRWFNGTLIPSWQSVLNELWHRSTPDDLEDDVARARDDADVYLRNVRDVGNRLAAELPPTFYVPQLQAFYGDLFAGVAGSSATFEGGMRVLAGQQCIRTS